MPDNITLLPLPPHSPELNPVENVWQYLRQNWLSLKVWQDYPAIVEACCQAWSRFLAQPEVVQSVTTRTWPGSMPRAVGISKGFSRAEYSFLSG